ncbi:MAG: hypothetical protein ACK5MP_12655 [Nostocoides sp.]
MTTPTVTAPAALFSRASRAVVTAWARRGTIAVTVTEDSGWTIVHPLVSRADAPYDDPVRALVSRPAAPAMRPAVFLGEVDDRAIVALHPRGLRRRTRYATWSPATGRTRMPELPALTAAALAQAFDLAVTDLAEALETPGRPHQRSTRDWLLAIRDALALPVTALTAGRSPLAAETVEPEENSVRRFNSLLRAARADEEEGQRR